VIDLKALRDDPDRFRRSQRARGAAADLVDELLAADERRRAAVTAADKLRAESNTASKAIQSASAD
jgi:seryl-tRNA synthetase